MRYVLINDNGIVENIIEYEEFASLVIPSGRQLIRTDEAGIGWTYAENVFVEPINDQLIGPAE